MTYADLPACIKPTFDTSNPPDDIGRNSANWDYWCPDRTGDPDKDFAAGELAARQCIEDGIQDRLMLSAVFATMIEKGEWSAFESGFTSVIARKSLFGARPHDFDEHTPADVLTDEQCRKFQAGMAHAIRDMDAGLKSDVQRRILPLLIMDKIEIAVRSAKQHPYVGGYVVTIISAATACCCH